MKFPKKKLGMDWWNARRRRPKEEEASENNSGTEPKNSNATVGILLQDYSSVTATACGTAERYLRYCASDAREEYWKTFWDEKLPKDAQFRLLQVHFLRKDGQRMTAAIPVRACMTVGDLLRGVQRIPSFSGSTFQKGHLLFVINGWRVLHLPDGWNSEGISTEQLFNTLNQDIGSLHVLQGISPGATTEPEPFMGVFPYRYRVSEISVLLIHCIIVIPLKLLSRHNKVDSFKCNVENPTEGETGKIDSNEYVSLEVALAPYDTVDGIKRLIERKTGLPMKIQRLAHGDAELHGFVRLREVMPNVCERTFQPLLKVMDSPYAFVVRTLSGETMPWYRTTSTITLFELKQTIARKTKIPVETQFLMFRGRELTVEDQIADCDIQEGSVVHCMAIPEEDPYGYCPNGQGSISHLYTLHGGTGKECGYVQFPELDQGGLPVAAIVAIALTPVLLVVAVGMVYHIRQLKQQERRMKKRFIQQLARNIDIGESAREISAQKLSEAFQHIGGQDGLISKEDLAKWMNDLHLDFLSEQDFNRLWDAMDMAGTGYVDPIDFFAFLNACGEEFKEVNQEWDALPKSEKMKLAMLRLSNIKEKGEEEVQKMQRRHNKRSRMQMPGLAKGNPLGASGADTSFFSELSQL
ncbi:unknown protein [Seminavis robusta]|uniref:Ubiquitin-like domain-containing protein n=1 Tax=Seminavis robusta TaxID=568900 RepID=A0A9N8HJU2_9STRA|nr:unknown protein [Seminavis robusta]|eukprot:Sro572_g168890.1 n/a (638) ;mRNA; r:53882-56111